MEPTIAAPPLIRALLRPEAYPHPVTDVQLRETPLSWVLLAGQFAYKIKKPVNPGFADFSTLERRTAACAEEVRLNRRLCPSVYLGVVNLVADGHGYAIDRPGQPVEVAVRMRRLPEAGMLAALLTKGIADERLIIRLARFLARFHTTAATGAGVDEWGSAAAIWANWVDSFAQTAPYVGRCLPAGTLAAVQSYVARFLGAHGPLLDGRAASGRLREGHGDLHVANICFKGRRPCLFDCSEFSPRNRCADVAADIACLAMDLDHHGRADLGVAFVDAYVRASGDTALPALLDFYKCYRAWARGKVLSLHLDEPGLPPDDAARVVAEARGYFDLAGAYASGLGGPLVVLITGPPASGKTTLAHALAGRLGLVHLSSDLIRKELTGHGPTDHRRASFGQGLYTGAMTRHTYAWLLRRAVRWLDHGHAVVLDATYSQATVRAAVRRMAARRGVRLITVHCQADEGVIRARLAARERDTQAVSDARLERWPALHAAYSPPSEWPGVFAVDMTKPLAAAVEQVLRAIGIAYVPERPTDAEEPASPEVTDATRIVAPRV